MSEKKIQVPDWMLKAAEQSYREADPRQQNNCTAAARHVAEAVLHSQRENAPVPTGRQVQEMSDSLNEKGDDYHSIEAYCAQWVRRMYDAPPETNPLVQRIKQSLWGCILTAGDAVELMDAVQSCVKPETAPEPEVPEAIKVLLLIDAVTFMLPDGHEFPGSAADRNAAVIEAYRRGQHAPIQHFGVKS